MARWTGAAWRLLALVMALVGVPLVLGISSLLQDQPIRAGEPSPRTVIAPELIRVADPEATERERRAAAASVEPVLVDDEEAKAAIVQEVRDVFAAVRTARERNEEGVVASRSEQVAGLRGRLSALDRAAVSALVALDDDELADVAEESVSIAQQFARQRLSEDRLEEVAESQLATELALRNLPAAIEQDVVAPLIRDALQPTVRVDEEATAAARAAAAGEISEVMRSFAGGSVIVSAGEVPDEVQVAALELRGLAGSAPWKAMAEGFLVTVLLTLATCAYLRQYRPKVWRSTRRLVLLASLFLLFAATLELATLQAPTADPGWLFLVPVGAIAMLATILFDPPVGVLVSVPMTVLVAFAVPSEPGLVAFAGIASLVSVPLVSRLSARGDLRRATGQATLAYIVLAGVFAGVFSGLEAVPLALLAGLGNGLLTGVAVLGLLPFLESAFGIVTATGLLDLADRNHPLLRELEQKALGSYNHSILVSTLVERAARAIGADALLGGVAALYHDIGKVRRPYFFVENQFGIANPHDELEPEVSAIIIQEHVTDGITMAKTYRLPPEVVEGIATHHGTTLVGYFYAQARNRARDGEHVDEAHFRYKGRKPQSKEMAILMLADCCEGASRAAAQADRNLSRDALEQIVRGLIADRVEDGQLDESALTFHELRTVTESFIETLVGVYHPRITYPDAKDTAALLDSSDGDAALPTVTAAARRQPTSEPMPEPEPGRRS